MFKQVRVSNALGRSGGNPNGYADAASSHLSPPRGLDAVKDPWISLHFDPVTSNAGRGSDSYEFITDPAKMVLLRDEWQGLCARASGHYLSQTFDWTRLCWETIAKPRGRRLFCLVARRDGRLGLVWPMVTFRDGLCTIAHPLDTEISEYSTVLVEDSSDAEERVEAAWNVLQANCRCDRLEFHDVRSDSLLGTVLSKSLVPALTMHQQATPWVSWDGIHTWEAYYRGSLSSSRRSDLSRKRRRLQEKGTVSFEAVTDPTQCDAILDWMFDQKREWLEKAGLRNDLIFAPEYRSFLSAAQAEFGPSGNRIIFTLKLDDRVLAAELSSVNEFRVEWFTGAYSLADSSYSPGQLLKQDCLRWAFDRRLDYDFRIGDEPEKLIWSNKDAQAATYAFANSAIGRLYVSAHKARAAAAQAMPPTHKATIKSVLGRLRAA